MMSIQAKRLSGLVVVPFILIVVWMLNPVTAQSTRRCVCHVENEDTGKGHVIEVDKDALKGHLRHGDSECAVDCDEVVGKTCNTSSGGKCDQTGKDEKVTATDILESQSVLLEGSFEPSE